MFSFRFKGLIILLGIFLNLSLHVHAEESLIVHGDLDFLSKTLRVEFGPEGNNIELFAKLEDESKVALAAKLQHFRFGSLDILANVYTNAKLFYSSRNVIQKVKFDASVKNLLINHLPLEDIMISGELDESILKINTFDGLNTYLFGFINLNQPYNLDLMARIKPFSLADFAKVFGNEDPNVIGDLEGVGRFEGVLNFPQIKANLVVYNGMLEGVPFKESVINFQGTYPVVRFSESKILGEYDDLYNLKGFLDLSKLDNLESPFHNFQVEPTGNKLQLADWNLMKDNVLEKEFTFRRDNEDFSVSFDSYIKDETKYRDDNKDTFELKLKLDDEKSINMKIKEDEGILGLERKVEF